MQIQGAVIREQGITFAIVIVKPHILDSPGQANEAIASFRPIFREIPTVLMAQDHQGVPTYYGRPDIVRFLANAPLSAIPWKEYTIS